MDTGLVGIGIISHAYYLAYIIVSYSILAVWVFFLIWYLDFSVWWVAFIGLSSGETNNGEDLFIYGRVIDPVNRTGLLQGFLLVRLTQFTYI